jgi:hypothetical protein
MLKFLKKPSIKMPLCIYEALGLSWISNDLYFPKRFSPMWMELKRIGKMKSLGVYRLGGKGKVKVKVKGQG